jgi:hypothetical protein
LGVKVIKQIEHPLWGSNLRHQLSAEAEVLFNGDGYERHLKPYRIWPLNRIKRQVRGKYVGQIVTDTTDHEAFAKRTFRHRCGLKKLFTVPGGEGGLPQFFALFDGHVFSVPDARHIALRFDPEVEKNRGEPIADVWFHGNGTRWGPLYQPETSKLVCCFANRAQIRKYVDLSYWPREMIHEGVTYSRCADERRYKGSDGSLFPTFLCLGLALFGRDSPYGWL